VRAPWRGAWFVHDGDMMPASQRFALATSVGAILSMLAIFVMMFMREEAGSFLVA
jgi:hypothetical protein